MEKILTSCFVTKTGNMLFFPRIALFHVNCYFICKVSPMYGFLAGFSSPESIFAGKILISCFVTKTGNMLFFPKIALFRVNCYFIGKVSPMYGFLAGFSSPESIFAEKNTYFLFCNQTGNIWKILICKSGMKLHARLQLLLTTKTRAVTIFCNTCSV